MPLTSKDGGRDLAIGDYVAMEWVIARVYPDVDVVTVAREGHDGLSAQSPQVVTVRTGTSKSALKLVPADAPLDLGTRCRLLWQVSQVYPDSGTVLVRRGGLSGPPDSPSGVTFSTCALASELEYVPPEQVTPPTPPAPAEMPRRLGGTATIAIDDLLPFTFEHGDWVEPGA